MTIPSIERRLEMLIEKALLDPVRTPNLLRALLDAPLVVITLATPAHARKLAALNREPNLTDLSPLPLWETADTGRTHWVPVFTSIALMEDCVPPKTVWARMLGRNLFTFFRTKRQGVLLNPGTKYQWALPGDQMAALAEGRIYEFGQPKAISYEQYVGGEDPPLGSSNVAASLQTVFKTLGSVQAAYALRMKEADGAERSILAIHIPASARDEVSRITQATAAVAANTRLEDSHTGDINYSIQVLVGEAPSAAWLAIAKYRVQPFYGGPTESGQWQRVNEMTVALTSAEIADLDPDTLVFKCPFCGQRASIAKSGVVGHGQEPCDKFQLLEPGEYIAAVNAQDKPVFFPRDPFDEPVDSNQEPVASLQEKRVEQLLQRIPFDAGLKPLFAQTLAGARVFVPSKADQHGVEAAMQAGQRRVPTLQDLEPIPTWSLPGESPKAHLPIFTSLPVAQAVSEKDKVQASWWALPAKDLLPLCRGRDVCLNPGTASAWYLSSQDLEELITQAGLSF